jgi:hypothetical protein
MIRLLTSEIQRVIVFGKKRVGKVHRRYVDVMRIYLGQPIKEVKPLFEARISREVVKLALERFKADFEDNGAFLMLSGEDVDEKVRRLVVFGGARQTVNESLGRPLLEIVASMNEVEVLFWYSRFIDAYERGGYWDVYRIAKSLRTLYRI